MQLMMPKSVITITDPPYGINYINGGGRNPKNGWRDFRADGEWDKERPSKEYFDELQRISKALIVWGGNYFTDYLPITQQWLVWNKCQREFSLADAEIAWSSQDRATRIFDYPRAAMLKENGYHPTQKPIALMKWCILLTPADCVIFDPFMGSGTSGIAAMQLDKKFIGIERDPTYFDIARRRIAQAALQEPLFVV
jgi:DNA modification methylase